MLLYSSTSRFNDFSLYSEGQCCIPHHGSGLHWDYSHWSASVLHWGPRVRTVMWWHSPVTCSTFCSSARAISAIVPCVPITAALSRSRKLRSYAQSQTQSIFMVGRNWRLQFSTRSLVLRVVRQYRFQEFCEVREVCPDIPAKPFLGGECAILDIKKICLFCLFCRRENFP